MYRLNESMISEAVGQLNEATDVNTLSVLDGRWRGVPGRSLSV